MSTVELGVTQQSGVGTGLGFNPHLSFSMQTSQGTMTSYVLLLEPLIFSIIFYFWKLLSFIAIWLLRGDYSCGYKFIHSTNIIKSHKASVNMMAWEIKWWTPQMWLLPSRTLGLRGQKDLKTLPCKYLVVMVIVWRRESTRSCVNRRGDCPVSNFTWYYYSSQISSFVFLETTPFAPPTRYLPLAVVYVF